MDISTSTTIRQSEHELFHRKSMSSLDLMNRVIERMAQSWDSSPYAGYFTHVVVYAGTGNNAGDAIGWAARLGLPVVLRQVGRLTYEAKYQYDLLDGFSEELPEFTGNARILIIDGLLGTGVRDVLRPIYLSYVREMNELRARHRCARIIAVDIPSGLDCDTGHPQPEAVHADMTMAIGCVKPGLLSEEGTAYTGRLIPIALPEISLTPQRAAVLDAELVRSWLPLRGYDTYKNQQGHVAIIAGSRGYIGAAQLAAEAAQAAGAGLVSLYCRDDVYELLAIRVPAEVMVKPLSALAAPKELRYGSILIGPGLGKDLSDAELAMLKEIVEESSCPIILDADGINLAVMHAWALPSHVLLTPHPGEMSRLMGAQQGSRLDWAEQFLQKHEASLLLKGARTIIASRDAVYYNATGGPYMANGGQGDALGGCIAALCAQGSTLMHAAACGAWLCGQAAERAHVAAGLSPAVTASQMVTMLPICLSEVD